LVAYLTTAGVGPISQPPPPESVIKYETTLKAEKFLLIVHGNQDEVERARDILKAGRGDVAVRLAA